MGRFNDHRKGTHVRARQMARDKRRPLSIGAALRAARDRRIDLDILRLDADTQSREGLNESTVQAYADAMQAGDRFPAIIVFRDGTQHILADGFHRVAAARRIGLKTFPADVREGTVRGAVLFGTSKEANGRHGLPLTASDRRRSVMRLLADAEWAGWADREIARHVGVSPTTVGSIRASLSNLDSETRTYTNRYGQTATMNTGGIGAGGRPEGRTEPAAAPAPVSPLADAPAEIREAYEAGRMSEWEAMRVRWHVSDSPQSVQEVALRLCPHDSEKVEMLRDLHKRASAPHSSGTFDEIARTGGFHYGDEMELWIDFAEASRHHIYEALKSLALHHRRLAAQAAEQARREAAQTPAPEGKYRCLVIDPPWPIQFIERDERPGQALAYPTMTLEQIEALPIADLAHDAGCHLYLWATAKFLPAAIDLVEMWGFKYVLPFTWVKKSGMTPFNPGFRYNAEHVVFATRGRLDVLTRGRNIAFEASSSGHSVKPDAFYQMVADSSPGPRLDMFARQRRDGFASWGHQAPPAETENTDSVPEVESEVAHEL